MNLLTISREKWVSLLLALPLIVVLAVTAYKFGPRSNAKPATEPANQPPPAVDTAEVGDGQLLKLFGAEETGAAKGRVKMTPTEYLNYVEALYRQRGYKKVEASSPANGEKQKGKPARRTVHRPIKFFQRHEENGAGSIYAVGTDADYNTDKVADEPFSFSTMVVAAKGESEWQTFRLSFDLNKIAKFADGLKNGDYPGADPGNVPRLAGLRRLYALTSATGSIAIYSSNEPEVALVAHYLKEMPRYGWRLDSDVAANAIPAGEGIMYFMRGSRFCMIWIKSNKAAGGTNVTISSY